MHIAHRNGVMHICVNVWLGGGGGEREGLAQTNMRSALQSAGAQAVRGSQSRVVPRSPHSHTVDVGEAAWELRGMANMASHSAVVWASPVLSGPANKLLSLFCTQVIEGGEERDDNLLIRPQQDM